MHEDSSPSRVLPACCCAGTKGSTGRPRYAPFRKAGSLHTPQAAQAGSLHRNASPAFTICPSLTLCCSVCCAVVAAVQSLRITLSARQHAGCQRQVRCLAETDTEKAKDSSKGDAARQLLGMKGASDETNIWKIRLQLTKPVTWVPLIWGKLSSNFKARPSLKLRLPCSLSARHQHHCSAEQPVLTHM